MKNSQSGLRIEKLFSIHTLVLMMVGLFLNFFFANIVRILGIPLYVDNVGSVLAAAIAGPIPGMTVGFLSNIINSISDPLSMYYGILTTLNALAAAWFSKKGYLRKISGFIKLAFVMMLIGGAAGSVMTWMLYGGGIGGIGGPLATVFYRQGFPTFWAQFIADIIIDVPDKLLTVLLVCTFIRFYPKKLYDAFPYSYFYDRSSREMQIINQRERRYSNVNSVKNKITIIMVVSSVLISIVSTIVGIRYYENDLREKYIQEVESAAKLVALTVDGNQVENYLTIGEDAEGYRETRNNLNTILTNLGNLEYVYVYQFQEDGAHVIFDFDTERLKADNLGDVVPFDESLQEYHDALLHGETMEPAITNDSHGWLITDCVPILNSAGETVAYGCVDISMEQYIQNLLIYLIKMISMLFGISLFICAFTLWYTIVAITNPINSVVELTRDFNEVQPENWLDSDKWKNRKPVTTGDEIEELYQTVSRVQENISQNVHKMKEAEETLRMTYELERKNQELALAVQKADEMNATKTEFYSRMSHDMRTPMNGIVGLVDLSKGETDIEVLQDNIEKIGTSSQYLLALINDTLDMSKIETKKMMLEYKAVQIGKFMESIKEMLRPTFQQKNQQFLLDYENVNSETYLMMDEMRVKQIFMNLISNAVKFTPENGRISFSIESEMMENDKLYCKMTLHDTGCGMSEEFLKNKIFQPFSQEQNSITISSAGSGLGLAIVKNLVELMDGRILVESELGKGTRFTVYLNFQVVEKPEGQPEKQKPAKDSRLEGARILVVEDHPLNAEIMTRILEKEGIESVWAENGQIGVELFEKEPENGFDAILMDIRMPVMDGIEATKAIRAMERPDAKTIPIIAMTANAYSEDREMTVEAGMNAYLPKPIDVAKLRKVLVNCIKQN